MKKPYRFRKARILAGVCAGQGELGQVDPAIIRLPWVVLSLTGGGILFHDAAWIIIPEEPWP